MARVRLGIGTRQSHMTRSTTRGQIRCTNNRGPVTAISDQISAWRNLRCRSQDQSDVAEPLRSEADEVTRSQLLNDKLAQSTLVAKWGGTEGRTAGSGSIWVTWGYILMVTIGSS